jgi:hypothetical protein
MIRFAIVGTVLSLVTASFRSCNQTTLFQPMLLHASPTTIQFGTNVTFLVYFAHQGPPVTNGTFHIETMAHGLSVYNQTFPMCDYIQCPIYSGNMSWTRTFDWPTAIPGTYNTTIQLRNTTFLYMCLQHQTSLSWF